MNKQDDERFGGRIASFCRPEKSQLKRKKDLSINITNLAAVVAFSLSRFIRSLNLNSFLSFLFIVNFYRTQRV